MQITDEKNLVTECSRNNIISITSDEKVDLGKTFLNQGRLIN